MDGYLDIDGSEKIIGTFGDWPSFHDAEVISINLDRNQYDGKCGPTIQVKIHVFFMTNEVVNGFLKTINHTIVDFIFYDAVEVSLNYGFDIQNSLSGFFVTDIRNHQLENINYEVHFDGHSTCDLRFKCSKIVISTVQQGIPRDSVYNMEKNLMIKKSSPPKPSI